MDGSSGQGGDGRRRHASKHLLVAGSAWSELLGTVTTVAETSKRIIATMSHCAASDDLQVVHSKPNAALRSGAQPLPPARLRPGAAQCRPPLHDLAVVAAFADVAKRECITRLDRPRHHLQHWMRCTKKAPSGQLPPDRVFNLAPGIRVAHGVVVKLVDRLTPRIDLVCGVALIHGHQYPLGPAPAGA